MQPAEPMAVPRKQRNSNNNQEIPEHLPAQMALAPEQRPYENSPSVNQKDFEQTSHNIANHSLSPGELGIVGYVKDVACFVKDAVQERRMNKKTTNNKSPSSSLSTSPPTEDHHHRKRGSIEGSSATNNDTRRLSSSPGEHREPTPLAEAITNLFPGIDPNRAGCTHADELRHDLMRTHSRESTDSPRLLDN
ncbi:hypothetical protein INT45_010087 [Circinella minor]|uniref:Uncharacterized protein n=1 Tax=Circinella minor TaxID=1195481 RepID=A0A8H7SC09_9FUNG|nr:hypothetical protein INT45_010087 [Circinella minor]